MRLTPDLASRIANIALAHTVREFPHKLDHVWNGAGDGTRPSAQHPIFYGSFDWHSCVHGYWLLLRLLRLFPDLPEAPAIRARADDVFTAAKVAGELAYLARPNSGGFERPYGWAWLLALHGEAALHDAAWGAALEPLARAFAARFTAFLPVQTYAIRNGSHANTAFALVLAHDWAAEHDAPLAALISRRARDWYGTDRDAQGWEPGGDDFLSPVLTEALLMQRVLPAADFAVWYSAFLPRLAQHQPPALFTPATVSDRSDGKIAHLDGLNLSRAWAWKALGHGDLAQIHLDAGLPHIAGDYAGEHWLATYAMLALEG
ncbi:DUF2891 domain-containing protein [Polymorphobacter arshaanensis]|uniref:DUF2891 domain-containing protein n=1 Tax=Glacieibacterium arshaanense TaxID=2511025 RepID=A0A4Y9EPR6_9SPHN|nr:DUF2891 domain-containing protein [Polymorphobacter arshaanensis]TFU05601.1 DUF2891 domain-containing protein [Polymorphobacter arshaanensis]